MYFYLAKNKNVHRHWQISIYSSLDSDIGFHKTNHNRRYKTSVVDSSMTSNTLLTNQKRRNKEDRTNDKTQHRKVLIVTDEASRLQFKAV